MTTDPKITLTWANVKKVLVVIAAISAAAIPLLSDGTPGSPRSIATAIAIGAAAGAAAI